MRRKPGSSSTGRPLGQLSAAAYVEAQPAHSTTRISSLPPSLSSSSALITSELSPASTPDDDVLEQRHQIRLSSELCRRSIGCKPCEWSWCRHAVPWRQPGPAVRRGLDTRRPLAHRWRRHGHQRAVVPERGINVTPTPTLQTFERVGASARADLSIPVLRVVVPF
jgi:hypothetical protein